MGVKLWVSLLLAAICMAAPAFAQRTDPEKAAQADFLKRAVFAEGRLWVLSDTGSLSSIEPRAARLARESSPPNVLDICTWAGRVTLIAADDSKAPVWKLYTRLDDGTWRDFASVRQEQDRIEGLACGERGAELLTNRRLIRFAPDEGGLIAAAQVPLKGELRPGLFTTLHAAPDALWIGVDAGEWGGGLSRIDTKTGEIRSVEKNATGGLCDGPLNTDCDPVNGIEEEPWAPECLVVSVGLEHMSFHGRLVEVCPQGIRTLYERPLGTERRRDNGKILNTVPFFGLIRVGDALLAAGANGLYRISKDSPAAVTPYPTFRNVGGVFVDFDNPRFVLVLTEINRHAALSGLTPLLIARPAPAGPTPPTRSAPATRPR